MVVALVAFGIGRVDGNVDGYTVAGDQVVGEGEGKAAPFSRANLGGEGDFVFPRDLGVLTSFGSFDLVPQNGAVESPSGGIPWR